MQAIENEVNQQLLNWCSQKLSVAIGPAKSFLYEMRNWRCCYLDNQEAVISCGGTHIQVIHPNDKVAVTLRKENDQELIMISTFVTGSDRDTLTPLLCKASRNGKNNPFFAAFLRCR